MPELIDISRTLTEDTPYWPGDTPFSSEPTMAIANGSNVNTSRFGMSPHVGTHIDAPAHVQEGAARMVDYELKTFFGPCLVIDVSDSDRAEPNHLPEEMPPRVLFKTEASYRTEQSAWTEEFASIDPELAAELARREVIIVGTDAASVDEVTSEELPTHHTLFNAGVAVMENLYLADVDAGLYQLIAFPLKCLKLEAAPVRAVLVH